MLELIQTPFYPTFEKFAEDIKTDCFICSPYITSKPIQMLVKTIAEKRSKNDIKINILTDISYRTLVQGATEILALLYLLKNHSNVRITYLPRIHAKVYIANLSSAVIASANFTQGGAITNFEYGVRISDAAIIQKIQKDMNEYSSLGADVTQDELEALQPQVENIQSMIQKEQANIVQTIKLHSTDQQKEIEDNLIRVRVKSKSINAIFSEILLYLLSKRPEKTKILHALVSQIHSDLCDDSINRVIDGKHYGKLWKHQVRNAQEYLRRTKAIFYNKETKLWYKTNR